MLGASNFSLVNIVEWRNFRIRHMMVKHRYLLGIVHCKVAYEAYMSGV